MFLLKYLQRFVNVGKFYTEVRVERNIRQRSLKGSYSSRDDQGSSGSQWGGGKGGAVERVRIKR